MSGPSRREILAGSGIVLAWALAGVAALSQGAVAAAEWLLAAYLVAGVLFAAGVWPVVWARSESAPRVNRRWWAFVLGVALLARLAVLPLAPSDDVARYVVEGEVVLHGENPYVVAPADPRLDPIRDERFARVNHADLPAIYPPLSVGVGALVSAVTHDERAWKLLGLAGDVVAIGLLAATLARRGGDPRRLLLYAWNPVPVLSFAGRGHNDVLLVVLVALAAWATAARRPGSAGAALAGAVLAKLSAGLLAPVLLVRQGWRSFLAFAALLALGLAPLALSSGDPLRSLKTFAGDMRANDSLHFVVYELLRHAGQGDVAAARLATLVSGGLVVVVVGTATLLVARRRVEPLAASAAVMTVVPLLAPTVHLWYLTWAVVLLPFAESVRPALAVWSVSIGLTLVIEIGQARTGEWIEPSWVRVPEYAPVFLAVVARALRTRRGSTPGVAS